MEYMEFLENKRHSSIEQGIKLIWLPDSMFDFQKYVTEYQIRKGRSAGFLDTGTGKTLIEIVVATNYIQSTNKRALIITPLAVAFQFIREAEKFKIDDLEYSKDGKFTSKIVVCNYERLHYFNPNDFECVILDESSILKNFKGAIREHLTAFIKKVKYRYLFTATPSPNDFIELGTSSEALGYMGYTDMLTKFFTNNEDTVSPQKIGTEWVLKGHAKKDFFRWVSSWSISMRKPSDLGFSDEGYELPNLVTSHHSVKNEHNLIVNGQIQLYNRVAKTRSEIASENKLTIEGRCERAVELASVHPQTVYWCNLNPEGDLLDRLDKDAVQVKGTMKLEQKEEILVAFSKGEINKLITKPKITAFGLNWQHCGHTVFFPTFSYEQYYQAIRRFWRYGRTEDVTADIVFSDGQKRVLDSLIAKAKKANELFHMLNMSINSKYETSIQRFDKEITLPKFLKAS